MHTPVVGRRPALETRVVARHGAEILPNPAQDAVGLLDAAEAGGVLVLEGGQVRGGEGVEGGEKPRAHDEDVAPAGLRVVLEGETGLHVLQRDGAGGEGLEGTVDFLFARWGIRPPCEVNEDAPASDPAGAHGLLDAEDVRVGGTLGARASDVVDAHAVVEKPGFLVAEVPQAVPL